jgi:hypothetical protein
VLLATAGVGNTTLKIRPPLPFDDADLIDCSTNSQLSWRHPLVE